MKAPYSLAALAVSLLAVASADAQVASGVMTVTGAEMHWWAGVAREATARLYDVDEDSVVFKKLNQTEKYDQGVVTFRARKGKLIDLDKLHESVWASRLAHGTRSGLVSLDVVVIGEAIQTRDGMRLKVSGSESEFVLLTGPTEEQANAFAQLAEAGADERQVIKLTGRVDDYKGRWPSLFHKPVAKPRRLLVTSFEKVE